MVAIDKAKGTYLGQFRLAGGARGWEDLRGMYVVLAGEEEAPPTLIWATKDGVYSSILDEVPDTAPSPSGSGGPATSGAPSGSPGGSAPASTAP